MTSKELFEQSELMRAEIAQKITARRLLLVQAHQLEEQELVAGHQEKRGNLELAVEALKTQKLPEDPALKLRIEEHKAMELERSKRIEALQHLLDAGEKLSEETENAVLKYNREGHRDTAFAARLKLLGVA